LCGGGNTTTQSTTQLPQRRIQYFFTDIRIYLFTRHSKLFVVTRPGLTGGEQTFTEPHKRCPDTDLYYIKLMKHLLFHLLKRFVAKQVINSHTDTQFVYNRVAPGTDTGTNISHVDVRTQHRGSFQVCTPMPKNQAGRRVAPQRGM